jgi:hypothetical protein
MRPNSASQDLGCGISNIKCRYDYNYHSLNSSHSNRGVSHRPPSRTDFLFRPSPVSQELGCGISNVDMTTIITLSIKSSHLNRIIPPPSSSTDLLFRPSPASQDLGCAVLGVDRITITTIITHSSSLNRGIPHASPSHTHVLP